MVSAQVSSSKKLEPTIVAMLNAFLELAERDNKIELNDTRIQTFIQLCEKPGATYEQIGEQLGMCEDSIALAAKDIFKILNRTLQIKGQIGKRNFRSLAIPAIKNYINSRAVQNQGSSSSDNRLQVKSSTKNLTIPPARVEIELEDPSGSVPINSKFYIVREDEARAYQVIKEPGAIIKIIGKRQSGATSLVNRLMADAESKGDRSITINFQGIELTPLQSINSFLKWFCFEIATQLEKKDCFKEYLDKEWVDERAGSCCQEFIEQCLLPEVTNSIIIIFDRIDYLFDENYEKTDEGKKKLRTAKAFFAIIRTWVELQRNTPIWEKIKYIIVEGEEEIQIGDKGSPFNVGEEIYLDDFSPQEIIELANRHQLNWSEYEVNKLTEIFDDNVGHPPLIRYILYRIVRYHLTFDKFINLKLERIKFFKKYLID